jgi:hypothetical protein
LPTIDSLELPTNNTLPIHIKTAEIMFDQGGKEPWTNTADLCGCWCNMAIWQYATYKHTNSNYTESLRTQSWHTDPFSRGEPETNIQSETVLGVGANNQHTYSSSVEIFATLIRRIMHKHWQRIATPITCQTLLVKTSAYCLEIHDLPVQSGDLHLKKFCAWKDLALPRWEPW